MTSELGQDGGLPPLAMLTVAAVARRLGVAPSTLRTWDRRYGLGPSAHTAGSHRRYSPTDISRLVVMRGLVMEGVPPAEAAQIALGSGDRPDTGPDDRSGVSQELGADVGAELSGLPAAAPRRLAPAPLRAAPVAAPAASATAPVEPGEPVAPAAASSAVASRPGPWPGPARAPHQGHSGHTSHSGHAGSGRGSALWSGVTASPVPGVPASRGVPAPEGSAPSVDGARGRAVWPATPLAARHLLQAADDLADAPDPARGDVEREVDEGLDQGVALDGGLDAALAQVIDDALGRTVRTTGPTWTGSVGRAGGGRVISLPDASPRARGLARAAMSLDTHELARLLRDAMSAFGVIDTWDTMMVPVLRGLGERWQATGEGIDVEHAFSEAAAGVLREVSAGLQRPRNVRPVLLACADGDPHSLPLHVLSAALAELDVGCRLLGVGMPGRALVAATRRTGPAAVFVYARMAVADATALREFPRQRPAPRVVVGGPGWQYADVPTSVVRVDSLRDAVDEVRAAVQV